MVAACWSPAMPRIAIGAAKQSGTLSPNAGRGILDLRQHRARHAQELQQFVVPLAGVDVEQQRARGIGGVGGVHLAAGQPPQQVAVDGAEQQFAALGALARAGHVIEQPGDLGAGEIGIDDQAGLCRDHRLVRPRPSAGRRCRRCGGPARRWRGGSAVPVARSHTTVVSRWLVMPIAAMSFGLDAGLLQRLAAGRERRGPDVLGLVLDPAGGRKMLREFLLRDRRRSRCRRETRWRATRWCPGRWQEQTAWRCFPRTFC